MTTIRIPRDFREFLKSLATHEVRFLVVGNYAVNAFGYVRNTVDFDIWIAADPENQQRTIAAVRDFGYPDAPGTLLDEPDAMLRMGVPPLRIEVMKQLSGVDFEDCWTRRTELPDGELAIPLLSLADLKRNKQAADVPRICWIFPNCLRIRTALGFRFQRGRRNGPCAKMSRDRMSQCGVTAHAVCRKRAPRRCAATG